MINFMRSIASHMKLTDQEILHVLKTGGPRVHKIMDYVYLKSRKKIVGYVIKNKLLFHIGTWYHF